MKVYQTDENGFFVGETIAKKSPLDNGLLIPAGCVTIPPPSAGEFKAARFINGAWALVDDLRGVEYWHDGQQHTIKNRGESLPEGASLIEPPELVAARELKAQQDAEAAAQNQILYELKQNDIKSIRAIREYLAAQPDATQLILDREAAAQATRAKLK